MIVRHSYSRLHRSPFSRISGAHGRAGPLSAWRSQSSSLPCRLCLSPRRTSRASYTPALTISSAFCLGPFVKPLGRHAHSHPELARRGYLRCSNCLRQCRESTTEIDMSAGTAAHAFECPASVHALRHRSSCSPWNRLHVLAHDVHIAGLPIAQISPGDEQVAAIPE
jgi:hypothetical protein